MSLINCPECGKEISDTSKKCIHCGYKFKKDNKKYFSIAPIFVILLLCVFYYIFQSQNKIPENMSEPIYNIGIQALQVTDDYIDGKITYSEASEELDSLKSSAKTREQSVYDNISIYILGIDVSLDGHYYGFDSISEVIQERNQLAEKLNCKKRN